MFDWFLDGLSALFGFTSDMLSAIGGVLVSIFEMTEKFYKLLTEFTEYIDSMTLAARNGTLEGLPLNGAIATYRYLVGEVVFHFTYVLIISGILFTLYKLMVLLYKAYLSYRSESTSGLTTPGSLLAKLTGLYK